jgi:stress-induced morphogen
MGTFVSGRAKTSPGKDAGSARTSPYGATEDAARRRFAAGQEHNRIHGRDHYHGQMAVEPLQMLLERAFPDATELRVEDRTGGGDHFQVTVASPAFNGLPLLDQHRLVNQALAEPLRDGTIHELRIKTKGTT